MLGPLTRWAGGDASTTPIGSASRVASRRALVALQLFETSSIRRSAGQKDTTHEASVDRVISSLQYLRTKHPRSPILQREVTYFRANRSRMQYGYFVAKGLPIGSGVVEAACKTLVAQRMKQSGMRWAEDGGQAILATRGWTQSGRFDQAWALFAATYQVQVNILDNVLPFRTARKRR